MKYLLLLLALQLHPLDIETEKYQEIDLVLNKMFNHTRLLTADKETEEMAQSLLNKYPDDPYVYHVWASTEWLLIGRELGLKADEQKDLSKINKYQERAKQYRQLVNKGLALTDNSTETKMLFFRAALWFDQAKFSARYESGLGGIKKADQEAAEGLKILKKILQVSPDFSPAYFFMGGNRWQLSTKVSWIKKPFVWKFSKVYAELYSLDKDVINEKKSIAWLERFYYGTYSDRVYLDPWLRKSWIENSLLLTGAYHKVTTEKLRGGRSQEGFEFLKKEVHLLRQLANMFPANKDIADRLAEKDQQLNLLHNYFSKK